MSMKLFVQAITKLLSGIILVGLSLFLSAGDIFFKNTWLFMGILFVPMLLTGIVMMLKKPELLKKRLKATEKHREQKVLVILSAIMFLTGLIVAGLTFRFRWYTLPKEAVIIAVIIFLCGYILYAQVIRENEYLSRVIEVCENQKVIETGLYSVVRHPMYSATLLMFLSMPLVLGSIYSFIIFLAYPYIIVKRLKSEEEFLEKNLDGYCEYKKKVKYRLIPFVW